MSHAAYPAASGMPMYDPGAMLAYMPHAGMHMAMSAAHPSAGVHVHQPPVASVSVHPPAHAAHVAAAAHQPAHGSGGSPAGGAKSKEDGGGTAKKGRKPYTITKPRESWTKEEHQFFLEALQLYERDWKKIGQHIPTKSIIQIRSHAQKYFIKMAKMGLKEFIPAPSRPKRAAKSASSKRASSGPKSKRQKTDGQGGEEDDDEEEDEDGGDGGGEDDGEGEGDDPSAAGTVIAGEDGPMDPGAASGDDEGGLQKLPHTSPGRVSQRAASQDSGRKKARPSVGGAARKPSTLRRAISSDSHETAEPHPDDGMRRSGRKRKMKKRFDEYGSGAEEEEDIEGDSQQVEHDEHDATAVSDDHAEDAHHQGHVDDEQTDHRSNASPYPPTHPQSHPDQSAPSTPMRSSLFGVGGGTLSSLAQLSPLSQLTQAGSLAAIASPHLLPQSAVYNPKLKPYPALGRSRAAGGLTNLPHNIPMSMTLPRAHPHAHSSALAVDTRTAEEGAAPAPVGEEEMQPEFAKVYSFLGSLFDPSTSGHIEELDKMTPVNKEIVQKLMQNLTTNLSSAAPTSASSYNSTSGFSLSGPSTDPLPSLLAPSARMQLGAAPKHVRTGSLGSLGSIDALGSPELAQRWLEGAPSVSPTPVGPSSLLSSSSSSALAMHAAAAASTSNGSPQPYLPRTFSANGLSVNLIPPTLVPVNGASGAAVAATAAGSGGATGTTGAAAVTPIAVGGTNWNADKSRPGFASSALVSRITSRGALSPLSVAPISSSAWPAQASPTAPSTLAYPSYSYANMSPSANTPLSFVGSPGGFFSPTIMAGQTNSAIPQYPATTAATTTTSGATLTVPTTAAHTRASTSPSHPAASTITSSSAGTVLASLSAPTTTAADTTNVPSAATTVDDAMTAQTTGAADAQEPQPMIELTST